MNAHERPTEDLSPEPDRPSRFRRLLQTEVPRKDFLLGLGGAVIGAPLGAIAGRAVGKGREPEEGARSYAQAGEDVAIHFLSQYLGIGDLSYLDIGAFDPVKTNNTYFFYQKGHRGVLVEPNPALSERLRAVRPKDTVLVAGIAPSAATEADYYLMTDPAWNTFSKEEAEHQEKITGGSIRVKKVIKMPLLNINDVMVEHFGGAPTYVSIDAEGLHEAILRSMDFTKLRPKVICVETLVSGSRDTIPEIPAFMETVGYIQRGGSFVNGIFVDRSVL